MMTMKTATATLLVLLLSVAPAALGQEDRAGSFDEAATTVQRQLQESMAELDRLRGEIADEMIPLSKRLNGLEADLTGVRREYQNVTRTKDSRTLDVTNLAREIKMRRDEAAYLGSLLNDYIGSFESRLPIAELQRYEAALEAAKQAPDDTAGSEHDVFRTQAALLDLSLTRLEEALGGARFDGTAVDTNGLVKHGTFLMVGPVALFRSEDGAAVGTAEQRIGSLEPTQIAFADPADAAATAAVVRSGTGLFPLDPTLGNAHKVEETKETLLEHVRKGGPVMYPIIALAGAALLVALFKWLGMLFVRRPSQKRVRALLRAVAEGDRAEAMRRAKAVGGPAGRMLAAGVEHLDEPRELIEEIMYETVLTMRLRLQRFLPFIAICAAAAPLLGLLGTVTGIINTFKLITVFGSGDVKMLSSGISEALITTESGLIVAIPALLLHALLARKARGVTDRMEKAAVAFVNEVGKLEGAKLRREQVNGAVPHAVAARTGMPERERPTPDQVREILTDLLEPVVTRNLANRAPANSGTAAEAPAVVPAGSN